MGQNMMYQIDLFACFLSILGGLIRIVLKVDFNISVKRQFVLVFIAALPSGYLAFSAATDYGFNKSAYPISFIIGIMAISIVSMIAQKEVLEIVTELKKILGK